MKFEDSRRLKGFEIMKLLQDMVSVNTRLIKRYNEKAAATPGWESGTNKRVKKLKAVLDKLSSENSQYLELHTRLLCFLKSLDSRQLPTDLLYEDDEGGLDYNKCLANTIEGKLDYDKNHPFYEDMEFRKDLIQHYIQIEDYESCNKLRTDR